MRIDGFLVELGHATTRSQAKQLILSGKVLINGSVATKPAQNANNEDKIEVLESQQYVGRGAKKIEAAIQHFKIDLKEMIVADIGASTGGFTDYLLQHGAQKVYAIDVGHGQLAQKLIDDPRVINMEGINVKFPIKIAEKVDLCVVDLSYISLRLTLENIAEVLKPQGKILALIKPQFEAGPRVVGKDGVIKDLDVVKRIIEDFRDWCSEKKLKITTIIPSPILGKEGNKEFLVEITSQ